MLKKYLGLIVLSFALSTPLFCVPTVTGTEPKLTVSAKATISKPADELQIKIGVVNFGETAQKALAENSARMQSVIDSLKAQGIEKSEYETGKFSINPTYTPYPNNPPANWKPSINGYEITNTIVIHTKKLDMAGRLIDVANKAGANSISDVSFTLRNSREFWSEALAAAVNMAVSDATTIAESANVTLVRVLNISLDNTQVQAKNLDAAIVARSLIRNEETPIEPGEVKITASITMVYEIGS